MGFIVGRVEIKLEKASTNCCSVFLNVCKMNNLPNAQLYVTVLPLILQPTSSPYKNQPSWWLSATASYRL